MKKMMIYLLIIVTMLILPNEVFAFGGIRTPNPTPLAGTKSMVETILGVLQWAGFAIATGMIIYIGIKYTMSAANEKAELKQSVINYVIGAIVIGGAATIANWCYLAFK